jgi:hypothetical protein
LKALQQQQQQQQRARTDGGCLRNRCPGEIPAFGWHFIFLEQQQQ